VGAGGSVLTGNGVERSGEEKEGEGDGGKEDLRDRGASCSDLGVERNHEDEVERAVPAPNVSKYVASAPSSTMGVFDARSADSLGDAIFAAAVATRILISFTLSGDKRLNAKTRID